MGKNIFKSIEDWFYFRSVKKRFKALGIPIQPCIYCGKGVSEWEYNDVYLCKNCRGRTDLIFGKHMTRIETNHQLRKLTEEIKRGGDK